MKRLGYNGEVIEIENEQKMREFGERLGRLLVGGETIELVGDVGAGKTTLVRGVALGMGVDETVQSPSFTISRVYEAPNNKRLAHYDFYRLADPGIMGGELAEAVSDRDTSVIIEWADTVEQTLPADRLTITIVATAEDTRRLTMKSSGMSSKRLEEELI